MYRLNLSVRPYRYGRSDERLWIVSGESTKYSRGKKIESI